MQEFTHISPKSEPDPPLSPLLKTYSPYPFSVVRGTGTEVFDETGKSYVDFYGGHCVALTGHCHAAVSAALGDQAHRLLFYSAAARLPVRDAAAESLVAFAGSEMASVFFCNSGAEANENALKVATKLTGRNRFVAFDGAFHGRTLLALSVTDAPSLRQPYEAFLAPCTFLPFASMAALEAADFSDTAAVIVEPIQSMAGVRTADATWFAALREKCSQAGTLLIFDEIQTGMGRVGSPFAANLYGVKPDLITCAKGMASGMPMGGVLMRSEVAAALQPGDLGSTFGGGPLACRALSATIQVLKDEELIPYSRVMSRHLRHRLHPGIVRTVRGEGLLIGLEIGPQTLALKNFLLDNRILVGGSNDPHVLRLMPPLNVSLQALERLIAAVDDFAGVIGA